MTRKTTTPGKQRTVFTFGSFHYDVAYRRTFAGYLDMSFEAINGGLHLLSQHPDYVFVIEQVVLVREFLDRHPDAKGPMRQFAKEGRLVFAPGMFTMPDVNLPNGESFVRNFLIGRDWLLKTLGTEPKVCWMADIFGHHPQLPQIAKLCGYIGYMFERGKTNGDDVTFWWEGIDGSRILTQWEIDGYAGLATPLCPYLECRGQAWLTDFAEHATMDKLDRNAVAQQPLLSAMSGDFRKAKESDVQFVKTYNRLGRKYRIVYGSPDAFFANVAADTKNPVPVVKADFNPLMQGTYSSRIRIKQANRRLENLAAAMDILETGLALRGQSVPETAAALWETQSWNAFHDIIAGTLEDNALKEALGDYQRAERQGRQAMEAALLQCAGGRPKTSARKWDRVVTLFNSLPYERNELVPIPLELYRKDVKDVQVFDSAGKPVATQFMMKGGVGTEVVLDVTGKEVPSGAAASPAAEDVASGEALVLAKTKLPPCSVRSFGVVMQTRKAARAKAGDLSVRGNVLENRYLRVVVGTNGTIISLFDKEHKREFADIGRSRVAQTGMNNIAHQPDRGDLWTPYQGPTNGSLMYAAPLRDPMAHSGIDHQLKGAITYCAADADAVWWPSIKIVEKGPLRAAIEVRYLQPDVVTRISLACDEKMIRFQTRFMPSGKHYRLRVAFPTAIRSGRIRASIPCGFVERGEGEFAAQDWLEYADAEGGLCLLNQGLPGNNVTDGAMILSLFRGVAMEDTESPPWYEQGVEQVFDYALCPFGKKDRNYNPARLGAQFNRPLYPVLTDAAPSVPHMDSLLVLDSDVAEVMEFRRVGKDYEVRLNETRGTGGAVGLVLPCKVKSCRRTDFRGKPLKGSPARIAGKQVTLNLMPFEIVTLRLALG